jgi:D-sedoheptulose 7-phosphate isomerase
MSMTVASIQEQIVASIAVKEALLSDGDQLDKIADLVEGIIGSLREGGKVIFAGNGGSFADAQHLSAEFVSRFMFDRSPLASVVLGANNSAISAIGNDYGFEQVFAREMECIAQPNDVFVPISTSGKSPNILNAVRCAQAMSLKITAFTGKDGGELRSMCDCICVPSNETARIQECHIMIGHIICGLVETKLFTQRKR